MESLALCSKILYDRDILEKQKEIVELKKKYYCTHGKPTLHMHHLYRDFDSDDDIDDPTRLWNRCTKLMNNIGESIFKLFNYTDESTYRRLNRESWDNDTPNPINMALLDSIKKNFKKILNNDPEFKNELTQIIYDNLSKFTESPLSSKEKTDEIIKYIFEMYPIIYEEYAFPGTLEKLIKIIRYKIFGVYEEDDLQFFDDETDLTDELSDNFEIIYYCDECKKVITEEDSKIFDDYQVCSNCINDLRSIISKYKKRKRQWTYFGELEKLIDS